MSIRAQCEQWQLDNPVYEACIEGAHKRALESYSAAIASKFDSGSSFTISDVWSFAIAVWELPANGLQYLAARVVTLHDFFELGVNDFTDPNPVLATPAALLTLILISAILGARS